MSRENQTVILWFRQDFRLADNPALFKANELGRFIPLFIYDDVFKTLTPPESAAYWWLIESVERLNESLGGNLLIKSGNAHQVLFNLIESTNAKAVCWNRIYDPLGLARDTAIKQSLKRQAIEAHSFNSSLLREPWTTLKQDQTPYRVFSSFYKQHYAQSVNCEPAPATTKLNIHRTSHWPAEIKQDRLLDPQHWSAKFAHCWNPGEQGARQRVSAFIKSGLKGYKHGRDFPVKSPVSGLSPHLHFGEISPRQVLIKVANECAHEGLEEDLICFHKELVWREFSTSQLYHWPDLPNRNLDARFDRFPWNHNIDLIGEWQSGKTGFPLIDAAMRELWQTGYMHNRLRMVTASFLVKNMMIDWRMGESWFRHCLLDFDLASNCANWQWVAGSGLDAAPYFRIFNPLTQSKKFDPEGHYIRRYVPEISRLPDRHIHSPSDAPSSILKQAGITLGVDYPRKILDLADTRHRALNAFQAIR